MIRYVSMLDFKDSMTDSDKRIAAYKIKQGLESLNGKIAGVEAVEVESILLPESQADMVIVAKLHDEQAMDAFLGTPLRLNFINVWNNSVAKEKMAAFIE